MYSITPERLCWFLLGQRFYSSLYPHPKGPSSWHKWSLMYVFLGWIEFVLRARVCLVVMFSLNRRYIFYITNLFSMSRRKQRTKKSKRKKTNSISSKTNAKTLKLQLHFSLSCEPPHQGPSPLADWEHILSSPHCSWQPCSRIVNRIFNLTRLFLSGSGREQGSCQFESWACSWQSRVDRLSGEGAMCTPSERLSCGLLARLPNNSTGFKPSCSKGLFTIWLVDMLLTLNLLVIQFLSFTLRPHLYPFLFSELQQRTSSSAVLKIWMFQSTFLRMKMPFLESTSKGF